jgi:hypothetical protein
VTGDRAHARPAGAKPPVQAPVDKPTTGHNQAHRALGNRAVGRLLGAAGGSPPPRVLDPGVRSIMEARFGADFGSVRVYAGPAATALAAEHRAKAFTVGEDIVFRDGEYAPGTVAGRRSIAHELAHVVQQRRTGGTGGESAVESDADQAARVFAAGSSAPIAVRAASPVRVARQAEADDSLGVLDPVVDAIARAAASGAMGGPLAPIAVAALRGFFAELRRGLSWTTLVRLAKSVEVGNFILGVEAGYVAGLLSPLTDLVGLVALARKIPELFTMVVNAYGNRAGILEEAKALGQDFTDWLGKLAKEIAGLDAKSMRELLDAAKKSGTEAASGAGHAAGRELVKTVTGEGDAAKESWVAELWGGSKSRERGYNVGHALGAVVSNLALFVLTDGVGDALVQIGARLAELGGLIGKGAELLVAVGKAIAWVEQVITKIVGFALKPLERLLGPLAAMLERLRSLLRKLLGAVEHGPAKAVATAAVKAVEKKVAAKSAAKSASKSAAMSAVDAVPKSAASGTLERAEAAAAAEAGRSEAATASKGAGAADQGQTVAAAERSKASGASEGTKAAERTEGAGAAESAESVEAGAVKPAESAGGADAAERAEGTATEAEGAQARKAEASAEEEPFNEALDREFADTPDPSRRPAPGQGVVTTPPEVTAGFAKDHVKALDKLLGKKLGREPVFARLWRDAARPGDVAILTRSNSRRLFNLHRNRFWSRVAKDPAALKLLEEAGLRISGGGRAPYYMLNGKRVVVTIDHIVERQTVPHLALSADNLQLSFSRENSVVLRLLHELDPFVNEGIGRAAAGAAPTTGVTVPSATPPAAVSLPPVAEEPPLGIATPAEELRPRIAIEPPHPERRLRIGTDEATLEDVAGATADVDTPALRRLQLTRPN